MGQEEAVSVRLPRELARALERSAAARGVPKSAVVREAVSQYLIDPPPRPAVRLVSGADLARAWAQRPRLAPGDAEAFERDIREAREFPLPQQDPWE
ncbi:MAG: ribbon-helix-helix protein, CopG family [Gemmatimonadetes bacterium]|nr:ribbon-helix-helix protein, CopG family [Gemmatimonadota bacterium]